MSWFCFRGIYYEALFVVLLNISSFRSPYEPYIQMVDKNMTNRTLPLIYAYQDSSVIGGVEMEKNQVIKLTADYLTCAENGKGTLVADVANNEPEHGLQHFEENRFGQSPLDIIGINVESWCSSTQTFLRNPDGTPGSYFSLYEALKNTSVPIIFTEV